jgi:pimeloyl-ACP methyl ester carboxylesterase
MKENNFVGLGPHGFHRIAYTEWGDHDNARVLVCVHGMTRTGRDFDALGTALAGDYRVLCPDVAGRGASDWFHAAEDYGLPQYCADMAALVARAGVPEIHWVGTSMGGLIGMMLAAQPHSPIKRLVLNDIGPFLPKAGIEEIAALATEEPVFEDIDAAARHLKATRKAFGRQSDAAWHRMAQLSVRRRDDGKYVYHYDPKIADGYRGRPIEDVDMWALWDLIECPVMVLRGAESTLLLAETAEEMSRRGPKATVNVIPDCGHAPLLSNADNIRIVSDWLLTGA